MTRVVVTDHAFVDVAHEERAAGQAGAELSVYHCRTPEETTEAVTGATVAFVNFAPMGRDQLAAMAPGAAVIRYGVGVDNVDVAAADELGVAVANVPDYGVDTVADHAAAMLLSLLRRLPLYDRGIREQGWVPPAHVGALRAFPDTVVGLLGVGRIARSLAERLRPFGFTILGYDPFVDPALATEHGIELAGLDDVLVGSHGLSLHLPVTPETHRLLNRGRLARLTPGCVVVNTSRGALVDESALAEALTSGQVAAAALDVFDPEPLGPDSPLRACPNAIFTPHAAFYSDQSLGNLQRLAAEEAGRALRGETLRCPVHP